MPLPDFSAVAGTAVQKMFQTYPAMRAATDESLRSGSAHVQAHLAEASAAHPVRGVTGEHLALQFQVAVQGRNAVAKALDDPATARSAFDHRERHLRHLFDLPVPAAQAARHRIKSTGKSWHEASFGFCPA